MIGLLAMVENVIPVVPADTAVALGAFLSHRGVTTAAQVFLVTWLANCSGATAVYVASRRYGRAFASGPFGRRLLSPRAIAGIEREYARFGVVGIFLSRFLPGIRSVVPAFAGLVRLDAARALIPLFLASAIWYGTLTAAGAFLGAEWETIAALIAGVNRTLGVAALAVIVVAVVLVLRARRRRREAFWVTLQRALEREATYPHEGRDPALRAAAALVLELVYGDEELTDEERRLVEAHLTERWDLEAARGGAASFGVADHAGRAVEAYSRDDRVALIRRIRTAALKDGPLSGHEERMIDRATKLLGLDPDTIGETLDAPPLEGRDP